MFINGIIFLIFIITSIKADILKSRNLNITIFDGFSSIDSFNVFLYDKFLPKNVNLKFDVFGKIAYLSNYEMLKYILDKYGDVYNNRWVSI
jgi:hypothetical protein